MALLAIAPVAALCADADGVIVFANDAAADLLETGVSLVGCRAQSLIPDLEFMPAGERGTCACETRLACGNAIKAIKLKLVRLTGQGGALTGIFLRDVDAERQTAILHTDLRRRTEAALADAEAAQRRLRFIIDMLPQAICVFDQEDRYILWNEKYAGLYPEIAPHLRPGIAFIDILRHSLESGAQPEIVLDPEAWLAERMAKHVLPASQEEQQLRDGRWLRHDERRMPDGSIVGMRIDITELKHREESLRRLFDANPTPMLLCDAGTLEIRSANDAAVRLYGEALPGRFLPELHVPEEMPRIRAILQALTGDLDAHTVWRHNTAAGERHVLLSARILRQGRSAELLLTVADVTERVEAETYATHLAHHDALTGLPNRMRFRTLLEKALLEERQDGSCLAVHYIDLDGFKPVNDTYGHSTGDELLRLVGERLRAVMPHSVVARLGGDEFAVLHSQSRTHVRDAERCIEALQLPFLIAHRPIRISASVGIAIAPADGMDAETLLLAADHALYRAKGGGKNTWRLSRASA